MSLFEALYGRKCNMLVIWDNPTNKFVIGPDLLKDMEEKMDKIKHNLNDAQDRKNIYADTCRTKREFRVGEHVFLKIKDKKSSLRLGSYSKLVARYCGLFDILKRTGHVAYMLLLPTSMHIHNMLHTYFPKKYVLDPN
jgi:hypothetical protein